MHTNKRVLDYQAGAATVAASVKQEHSVIIPPCFIGENVVLKNSVVGPFVSIGANSRIESSVVSNSILQTGVTLKHANVDNSMIGHSAQLHLRPEQLSISDYSTTHH